MSSWWSQLCTGGARHRQRKRPVPRSVKKAPQHSTETTARMKMVWTRCFGCNECYFNLYTSRYRYLPSSFEMFSLNGWKNIKLKISHVINHAAKVSKWLVDDKACRMRSRCFRRLAAVKVSSPSWNNACAIGIGDFSLQDAAGRCTKPN